MIHYRDLSGFLPLSELEQDIEMMTATELKLIPPHVCTSCIYMSCTKQVLLALRFVVKYNSFTPGGTPLLQQHTQQQL